MESWLRPMLCNPVDVVPEGPEWVIEGKLDGWRMVAHKTSDGSVRVYGGRNGNSYTGQVPYIEEALSALLPPDTAVDGELIAAGTSGAMGDVQSIMTSGVPHIPTVHIPALTYVLFDVIQLGGADLRANPWTTRRAKLEATFGTGASCLRLSPYAPSSNDQHEQFLALGLEGSVCKRKDSHYYNRRTSAWVKIKPQTTAEAVIVGFKPGKKGTALEGKCGAFKLEMLPSGAKTTVKCGTDDRHQDATDHPERWLGKVIEIAHHGIGPNGVPRHPQFLRVREDLAETPRERQVREALNPPKVTGAGRMRNYGAMKREKLERCLAELKAGVGDAHDRCLNGGSGNPQADIQVAEQVLREKHGVAA
jgi:ATP-dependent DNA ligase